MEDNEQHLRLNRAENDEPLIVLKYVPWRIAWRLFFPYSMGIPLFYMIVFHWAPRKPGIFVTVFLEIVGILGLVGGACLLVDMLLMKDFKLYKDRAAKTYRLFGTKQVPLKNADVVVSNYLFGQNICFWPKGSSYVRMKMIISFDCNLVESKCLEDFTEACKLLGIEFTRSLGGLTKMKSDYNKRG